MAVRPAFGSVTDEVFGGFRTAPTFGDPGGHVVGKVAGVALVVERELLDSLISDAEVVEFVGEVPLAVAARTTDRRRVVNLGRWSVVAVGSVARIV